MRVQALKTFVRIEEPRSTRWILRGAQCVEITRVRPKLMVALDVYELAPPPEPLTREVAVGLKFNGNLTYWYLSIERRWNVTVNGDDLKMVTNIQPNV